MMEDFRLWLVTGAVVLFKILASPYVSLAAAAASVIAALVAVYMFTPAVIAYFQLDASTHQYMVAGLVALTGENLMKWAMAITPERLLQMWKDFKR